MRWRLRLAEFNFEIAYRKGCLNYHGDALSRFTTLSETIHENDNDVPTFLLTEDSSKSEHTDKPAHHQDCLPECHCDECRNEEDEILAELSDELADELYAALPDPTKTDPMFQTITDEELLTAQLSDPFCSAVRRHLNEGVVSPFFDNDSGVLSRRSAYGDQVAVPHVLKPKVLHIHHYSRLSGHP